MRTLACCLAAVVVLVWTCPAAAEAGATGNRAGTPMKVFVLAGQSNMVGQGVADLEGKDYNEGRGTLKWLMRDAAKADLVKGLADETGVWVTREDVWVRYRTPRGQLKTGGLSVGFTGYDGRHHFGPELGFGRVVGDALDEEVLLIKTAWGGKSLVKDFRPPSSGGETGPFYTQMIAEVKEALANIERDFPKSAAKGYELAGFVWYHGWNDGVDKGPAVEEYEANLANLITDVRRELGAPNLSVVIGEITGPWVQAPKKWEELRAAQAAAAKRPEFKGTVRFVPTREFVRKAEDSPHPGHAHHEFGNAETYLLVGDALGRGMLGLLGKGGQPDGPPGGAEKPKAQVQRGELSGYMLVPVERAPAEFNAGFSLYAAAWPLLEEYPGSRFQTGLFGTWMFGQFAGGAPKDFYTDIEGGLGWWRDTRFATPTPKFIMGGVTLNFSSWANGPGAGKGRDWNNPAGKYGVAQLSPWVVWPPDGLNLAQGTCGELFGYGYLPLPLIDAKATTAGRPIPTGDQCWTLFLNTENFKGPVCFFTPYFWSASAVERPEFAGMFLDSRPSEPNKAFQMETQWVPATISTVATGEGGGGTRSYAKTAAVQFPADEQGRTVVLHRLTTYTREALTEPVRRWFAGGEAASGAINPAEAYVKRFGKGGGSTWRIFADGAAKEERRDVQWARFGKPAAHDEMTFGYVWDAAFVKPAKPGEGRVRLPEYYRLEQEEGRPAKWTPVAAEEVPEAAGLKGLSHERPKAPDAGAYETPTAKESPFGTPGPVAGPFEVTLGDGSVLTYAWYRFADQPAMLNADLSDAEREAAQRRVEMIHRAWTKERTYLPPPTTGRLASLDPALLVTPPKGLEIGYVPIALRQEKRAPAK